MKYIQVLTPKPKIPCTPGMCLVYVREAFGIQSKYPSASANWDASTTKHDDRNFPQDVWLPIWFSLDDNPHGHVALRQPDGSVWSASDPNANDPVHHESINDIERYYGGKLHYLGWTEDVCDEKIVRPEITNEPVTESMEVMINPENEVAGRVVDVMVLEEHDSKR